MILWMCNIKLFRLTIVLFKFGSKILVLKLFLHILLNKNLFTIHNLQSEIYNALCSRLLAFFRVLRLSFFYFFTLFCQFQILKFNFPWHNWLNDVILLIPCKERILKRDRHAVGLMVRVYRLIVETRIKMAAVCLFKLLALSLMSLEKPFSIFNLRKLMATKILIKALIELLEEFNKVYSFLFNNLSICNILFLHIRLILKLAFWVFPFLFSICVSFEVILPEFRLLGYEVCNFCEHRLFSD